MSIPFTLRSGLIWPMNSMVSLPTHTAGQRSLDDKWPLKGAAATTRLRFPLSPFLSSALLCWGSPLPGVWAEILPFPGPMERDPYPSPYQVFFFFARNHRISIHWLSGGLELLSGTRGDALENSRAENGDKTAGMKRSRVGAAQGQTADIPFTRQNPPLLL